MKKLCLLIVMLIISLNLWPSDLTYKKLGVDSTGKMLLMLYSEDSIIYVDNEITIVDNQIIENYSHQIRYATVYDTIKVNAVYANAWFSYLHLAAVVKAYQNPHYPHTWEVTNQDDNRYDWSNLRVYYDLTEIKGMVMYTLLNEPSFSETVIMTETPVEELNVELIIAAIFLILTVIILWGDIGGRLENWVEKVQGVRRKLRSGTNQILQGLGVIVIIGGVVSFLTLAFQGTFILLILALATGLLVLVLNYFNKKKSKANQ